MPIKFEETYDVNDYEILTDTGWRDIHMVGKTVPYDVWKLKLEDSKELLCADNHIVFKDDDSETFVKDLNINDKVKTKDGNRKVIECKNLEYKENMYDVQVDNEKYYSNNILSHNTTIVSVYTLWYSLFNKNKVIGIVSNKESSAKMILSRIKDMYECLPVWLKPGVTEYSKMFITFENKTKIRISATTADAFRGDTLNLLAADELAFVPGFQADEFWAANYPTISASQESKIITISCVTDDTYIFTNNGLKQLKDFIIKDKNSGYIIDDYSIYGKSGFNNGNLIVNNETTDTKIIHTTSTSLEGSNNHKLWSCKNGKYGWHKLSELNVGDYVSIKYGMNVWGNNDEINFESKKRKNGRFVPLKVKEITEDWAYLFGLYISEGYADKYKLNIACGDDISEVFDRLNLKYSCYDGLHYTICRLSLIELLKHVGFDINRKSPRKIIPKRLLEMSPNNIASMLRGIFDGDGYARTTLGSVGIGLSSKKLIMQIKMLLLNFGILTDYYEVESKPTKKVKVHSMQYRITCQRNNARKFYNLIGFNLKRKQKCKKLLPEEKEAKIDIIPYSKKFLISFPSNNYPKSKFGIIKDIEKYLETDLYNRGPNGHLSRPLMLRIKNILNENNISENIELREFFDNNVSENIKWEKIKSIEDSKNKVYDFSLPEIKDDPWCHSILYNGLIGHQTPNGMFNVFHSIYVQAESKNNTFIPTKISWERVPGRDEEWAKIQRENLGKTRFAQEFACITGDVSVMVFDMYANKKEIIEIGKLYKNMQGEIFKKNERYKILTPNGYSDFDGINAIEKDEIIKFELQNRIEIKCSVDHKLLTHNGFVQSNDIEENQYISTIGGFKKIIKKEKIKGKEILYDPINVKEQNIYYSNGIISHNCEFLGSTNTVIETEVLKKLMNSWIEPTFHDLKNRLAIFEKPDKDSLYILGVDPSKGTGEHASTIQILKVKSITPIKLEQVAVFNDNFTDVYEFSEIVNRLSYYYNNGYIMCENNGEGSAVITRLWWEYENENLINTGSKTTNLGIRALTGTKSKAVLLMKKLIEDWSVIIHHRETIEELGSFIEENGRFFGKDKPDDLVSALYWALYFLEMDILDEKYEFRKGDVEEDAWGVLSDINDKADADWSWLTDTGRLMD